MIGLEAEGTLRGDEAALRAALEGLDAEPAVTVEAHDGALFAQLYPFAEPARFALDGDRVRVEASSAPAGPGYHAWLCEALRALPVDWDRVNDDSGYFYGRAREPLEELFVDWLGAAAAEILERASEGVSRFALGMPEGHRYTYDGVVATLLGPRDREWLEATRSDASAGTDVFPWWNEDRDAQYFERLARASMWLEVRWRPPVTDDERATLDRVVTWVERAHGLDPERALPWAEQAELFTCLEEESLRATRARMKASKAGAPAIGYRRRPVRVELSGGWSMQIDGDLAERWEERGTWVGWDDTRSVWFNSLTVERDGAPSPDAQATLAELPALEGDEILELEAGPLRGMASFREEEVDGETVYRLEAHAAQGHHAAIGTLVFTEASDRQWALETWGSLYRQASGGSSSG